MALIPLLLLQDDDADTIREAFKIFDRDKDGFISTKELKKVTRPPIVLHSKLFTSNFTNIGGMGEILILVREKFHHL